MKMKKKPKNRKIRAFFAILPLLIKIKPTYAGSSREAVMGPGSIAILNSSYRPALTSALNGMTDSYRAGLDFTYQSHKIRNQVDDDKKKSFGVIFYGLIPLWKNSKNTRPSGLVIRSEYDLMKGNLRSGKSSNDLANESESTYRASQNALSIGGILALSNSWMMSFSLNQKTNYLAKNEISYIELSESVKENISKFENSSKSPLYPAIGFRLRLSRYTSAAFRYNHGYFDNSGKNMKIRKQFLNSDTEIRERGPAYSQKTFTSAFKTRIFKTITMVFGIHRSFKITTTGDQNINKILADEKSNINLAFEHKFRYNGSTWLPRVGFETITDRTSQIALGLSLQSGKMDLETAVVRSAKSDPKDKQSQITGFFGIGYRFDSGHNRRSK